MSKDLTYYLNLPYEIRIETDIDEGKKVYYAYISELGRHACYGKGNTREEALSSLDEVKKDIIASYLEHNNPVPEPSAPIEDILPRGKFVVRTNPIIHKRLLDQSRQMGISLNLLVNQLLVHNAQSVELKNYFDQKFDRLEKCFEQLISAQKPESKRYSKSTSNIY